MTASTSRWLVSVLLATALCSAPGGPAQAWTIEGAATHGCHERMTMDALTEAGYVGEPPVLTGDDRLLFESVGFDCSYLDRNRWALSLALGVRYFDVGRYSAVDLSLLTGLHNDPDLQANHCLRSIAQDGEEGDAEAVGACRDLIRHELSQAWDAGDPGGTPDASVTEDAQVYLLYQGARAVPVSTFYFHLGRALHVLQDSFTHTYRSGDLHAINEVCNWVEDVSGERRTDRDGPPHPGNMDDCRCPREWMAELYDASLLASTDLIALASMEGTRVEREEALETFFDTWMTHTPGCTAENGWCDSPIPVDLEERPCGGCSLGAGARDAPAPLWVLALALASVVLAMTRRRP